MTDAGTIATRYIELVGAHDLTSLDDLFAENLVATTGGNTFDRTEWTAALARLLPVLIRNDFRELFVSGDKACVIYDFVTDTSAGAVPCVEWITVAGERIATIELIFEKANWAEVTTALRERAAARV